MINFQFNFSPNCIMISLKKITKENFKSIIDLKVSKHQKSQITPNSVSIAQGHYYKAAWLRGIYYKRFQLQNQVDYNSLN